MVCPAELDVALVTRIAGGDEDALGLLYDAHAPAVYRLAQLRSGDEVTAAEVTAAVFGRVWREAASFDRSAGSVRAWLLSLASWASPASGRLDDVPSQDRVALELAYFGGLTVREIARELHEPQDRIRRRLRRALERLRVTLSAEATTPDRARTKG